MADLGPWEALSPEGVRALFADAPFAWWLGGGWSLDRLAGYQTRDHADTDVQVLRPEAPRVRGWLAHWDVHVADPPGTGTLRPWPLDEELGAGLHDVWCRRAEGDPWRLQLMVADVEGEDWVYRRAPRIRRPVTSLAGRASAPGLPVLAPEIQLLYKSKGGREKDQADFVRFAPLLTGGERGWLRGALETASPGHPWLPALGGPAGTGA